MARIVDLVGSWSWCFRRVVRRVAAGMVWRRCIALVFDEGGHVQGDEWQMRQLEGGLVVWVFVGRVSEDAELLIETAESLVAVFVK